VIEAGRARTPLPAILVDAALVMGGWWLLLIAENDALGLLWRDQFSAVWEIALSRHAVVPIAFVGLAPLAFVAVGAWRLAERARAGGAKATSVLGLAGAAGMGALAWGVSHGRHFARWPLRVGFVVALVLGGAFVGARLVPRVGSVASRPLVLAGLGSTLCVASWVCNAFVLPRLYPAFHAALVAATLAGAAGAAMSFRTESPTSVARAYAAIVALGLVSNAAAVPRAVRALDRASNLRIALVEHAPLLGPVVVGTMGVRALFARTAGGDDPPGEGSTGPSGLPAATEVARALDWTGHDLVLFSVDALRADHVSAYGYHRPTTPNIDALAGEGTLFERAYCPTPHTSYSVTSMLTGKYIRPLLRLGLGVDSETWPEALRRYGWHAAAFYPPAVFFIDQESFTGFEERHLGFEYAKVEFADPALRERQVGEYLDRAAPDAPLFLWVHLFEPHEPYVVHAGHVFVGGPSADIDAYDSEVAEADEGIGRIVRLMRERRPGAVIVLTADHGEEFGDHGGRYHGTTVYEEQVRVPLVIVGPRVRRGVRVQAVVQTIDLLPTTLSALGIPRPARVRGRDLGPLLTGPAATDGGFAFVEAGDYALVASGNDRLVCQRRAAACALYRLDADPAERNDLADADPPRFDALRATLRSVERDHGRYESSGGPPLPEALRRGMQGETEAAIDVATLLDDADVTIRRRAAEVCFQLRAPPTIPALRRALARDEDEETRRWSALALSRMGEPGSPLLDAMLRGASRDWRRRAAEVLAENGDPRGCDEIAAFWDDVAPAPAGVAPSAGRSPANPDGEPPRLALELARAQELLSATTRARCRPALPALVRALGDVRARPFVADTLGALADKRDSRDEPARRALLSAFAEERYVTTLPHEARALLALGVHDWAATGEADEPEATFTIAPRTASARLLVLVSDAGAALASDVTGSSAVPSTTRSPVAGDGEVRSLELRTVPGTRCVIHIRVSKGGILAAWLVPNRRLD
jgi:arylsulfatase A-like enzyme